MNGSFRPKYIEKGDVLARVFNHTRHFGPFAWNPTRPSLGLTGASCGRFDFLPSHPGGDGFLYCSESGPNEAVAIVETLKSLLLRDPVRGDQNVLDRRERDCRTIQLFKLNTSITLVDIHRQDWRECFHMDEEVQYSGDRDCTRRWAAYIRDQVVDAAGIAYNSTQETAVFGQSSMVLWEAGMAGVLFEPVDQIPLGSAEGRRMMEDALSPYRVLLVN